MTKRSSATTAERPGAVMPKQRCAVMPKRVILAATAGILLLVAMVPQAHAERHELYWQAGADFLNGPSELIAGVGSGPGYRFHVDESWRLASEVRFLLVAGNRIAMGLGGEREFAVGSGFWRPSIGIFGHMYLGQRVVIIDSDNPEPGILPSIALSLRVNPLHFRNNRYSATVLGISPAVAVTSNPLLVGFSVTLLAVGAQF